ncbi:unnamed protein product [Angiostrongylus costaricensis]|uniref:ZP domain-containing protein n=1 Tax=Angiostrongylus costaricensis TaxID=334426 RepID=A0A0R3PUJ5_ANGCS|nr:unnamed protein product [Angiostrongylus costaricensis]
MSYTKLFIIKLVDQMENQVYVQIEKDAQTTADRQFLFVCQLADAKFEKKQPSDYDIRRHPVIGTSGASSQRYPVPPEMKKTPSPYRMWTYPEPVKSNTVPRVAAFSSDGHLGNWPIPGARPYAPNVTPVSSWPRQPLPEPIIPQTTPENRVPAIALSEVGGGTSQNAYRRVGALHLSMTTPKNPFLSPVVQPIASQRTKTDDTHHGISYASAQIFGNPVSSRTPSIADEAMTSSYVLPQPAVLNGRKPADQETMTKEYLAPPEELSLEIQYGVGPYAPTVSSPVKIGDNISLVVRSKSHMKGENDYDIFVHSCSASDGEGKAKIELVDKNGCATRPQFSSQMKRTRDSNGLMYYFIRITAFKFPGPDDVYFSCSIDLTPFRNAPEICPAVRRAVRQTSSESELRLFDSVKVELDALTSDRRYPNESYDNDGVWVPNSVLAFVVLLFSTLFFAVLLSLFTACFFYRKILLMSSSVVDLITILGRKSAMTAFHVVIDTQRHLIAMP